MFCVCWPCSLNVFCTLKACPAMAQQRTNFSFKGNGEIQLRAPLVQNLLVLSVPSITNATKCGNLKKEHRLVLKTLRRKVGLTAKFLKSVYCNITEGLLLYFSFLCKVCYKSDKLCYITRSLVIKLILATNFAWPQILSVHI